MEYFHRKSHFTLGLRNQSAAILNSFSKHWTAITLLEFPKSGLVSMRIMIWYIGNLFISYQCSRSLNGFGKVLHVFFHISISKGSWPNSRRAGRYSCQPRSNLRFLGQNYLWAIYERNFHCNCPEPAKSWFPRYLQRHPHHKQRGNPKPDTWQNKGNPRNTS